MIFTEKKKQNKANIWEKYKKINYILSNSNVFSSSWSGTNVPEAAMWLQSVGRNDYTDHFAVLRALPEGLKL